MSYIIETCNGLKHSLHVLAIEIGLNLSSTIKDVWKTLIYFEIRFNAMKPMKIAGFDTLLFHLIIILARVGQKTRRKIENEDCR